MCQLTLIDLKKKSYNNLFLYLSLVNNSKVHKDGFGFLANKQDIFKSEKSPRVLINLSEIISTVNTSDEMILSHVRQIAVGKVPLLKDSHPFRLPDFILAHNGTLKWKDQANESKYTGIIDSEIFASELQLAYNSNPNFVECIKNTYEKFTGKFAFLIYNIRENKFYVVRGKTAKLHLANIFKLEGENSTSLGYIINTELDTAKDAIETFIDIVELMDSSVLDYKIEEIDEECIYEYTGESLIKLSEIKENIEVKQFGNDYDDTYEWCRNSMTTTHNYHKVNNQLDKIESFLTENLLNLVDLDNLCYVLFNKCLLECSESDINVDILNNFAKINSNSKKRYWSELKYYIITDDLYMKYQLNYPYFINPKKKLSSALNTIKRELAEQRRNK